MHKKSLQEFAFPFSEIKEFLDQKVQEFNCPAYIESDPIQIPHRFSRPEDIEIAAFFAATLAWGNRKSIIRSASILMTLMDHDPLQFILHANPQELQHVQGFVHRTFNGADCRFFILSLRNIYQNYGGLKTVFEQSFKKENDLKYSLIEFRKLFLEIGLQNHVYKHVSNAESGSAAKRLNLFLRWMVRHDKKGVDFGLWQGIPSSALYIPLDVHAGNVARSLGLLTRKQNDWKAVEHLTNMLKSFDPNDPIKYDYALFGLGVFEAFGKLK